MMTPQRVYVITESRNTIILCGVTIPVSKVDEVVAVTTDMETAIMLLEQNPKWSIVEIPADQWKEI